MPSCADMLSTYCPRLPPSMATASGHLMFLVHETKGAPDFFMLVGFKYFIALTLPPHVANVLMFLVHGA